MTRLLAHNRVSCKTDENNVRYAAWSYIIDNIFLDILDRGVGYVKISKSKEERKRKRNCHLSPSCSPLKSLFTNRSHE